jgi:hypothetical protein
MFDQSMNAIGGPSSPPANWRHSKAPRARPIHVHPRSSLPPFLVVTGRRHQTGASLVSPIGRTPPPIIPAQTFISWGDRAQAVKAYEPVTDKIQKNPPICHTQSEERLGPARLEPLCIVHFSRIPCTIPHKRPSPPNWVCSENRRLVAPRSLGCHSFTRRLGVAVHPSLFRDPCTNLHNPKTGACADPPHNSYKKQVLIKNWLRFENVESGRLSNGDDFLWLLRYPRSSAAQGICG